MTESRDPKTRVKKKLLPQFSAEEYVRFLEEKQTGKLLTKFGVLKDDGELGALDIQEFLIWVREHRNEYSGSENYLHADWVIKYKIWLAEAYCSKFHNMAEKLP